MKGSPIIKVGNTLQYPTRGLILIGPTELTKVLQSCVEMKQKTKYLANLYSYLYSYSRHLTMCQRPTQRRPSYKRSFLAPIIYKFNRAQNSQFITITK